MSWAKKSVKWARAERSKCAEFQYPGNLYMLWDYEK